MAIVIVVSVADVVALVEMDSVPNITISVGLIEAIGPGAVVNDVLYPVAIVILIYIIINAVIVVVEVGVVSFAVAIPVRPLSVVQWKGVFDTEVEIIITILITITGVAI